MILLALLWSCFALIFLIVITVVQSKRSVKKEKHDRPKTTVDTAETHSITTISTMRESDISLSSDCLLEDRETKIYEYTMKDESKEEEDMPTENLENDTFAEPVEDLDFDKFRPFVDEGRLKGQLGEGRVLRRLNRYITDSLDKWKQIELNIAVTGNSGSGKSSLINALRNLKPSDKGAAAVGIVETTTECSKYIFPQNPNVALWDLPGIGTQRFAKAKYLEKMEFSRFEVVIIVSAGRFLENDIWLGEQIRALRKNVIFVRTKIDIDLMNAKRDYPGTTEEHCLTKLRKDLSDNIRAGKLQDSGVFLVSSPERKSYDFKVLDETLKGMLSIKGKAIRSLVQNHVQTAIRNDQQRSKNEFKVRKVASAVYGFLPIPNLETGLGNLSVSRMRDICLEKFCIDEKSLNEMANEVNISKTILKTRLNSYQEENNEKSQQTSTERKMWSNFRMYSKYIFPIVGMFLSAHKSYATTNECLKIMCDVMAEDEQALAILRLNRLEEDLTPIPIA